MKNYYLLLFLFIPFLGNANNPIYSEKDFHQTKGLYKTDAVIADNSDAVNFVYIGDNYTAFFQEGKVIYVALDALQGEENVNGIRLDVDYIDHLSTMQFQFEDAFQSAKITKSINGTLYKLQKVDKITMEGIYSNIDLEFFVNEEGLLQYQYLLEVGANPSEIQVKYSGNEGVALNPDGALEINTEVGTMTESSPITFKGRNERTVKSQYILNKNNTIGFSIKSFNSNKEYIIDPYIKWSTFFGGTA